MQSLIKMFTRMSSGSEHSVLAVPLELRHLIYDELEPEITIEPQYPEQIRKATEPGWEPGHLKHPMLGVNKVIDEEIASRYHNKTDLAHPPFFPKKTTFRIWYRQSRLQMSHMDCFFRDPEVRSGVRHIEYIVDGYTGDPWGDHPLLDPLRCFPNLTTVRILAQYDPFKLKYTQMKVCLADLKKRIGEFFDGDDSNEAWLALCKEERPKWNIEEWCILDD